MKQSMQVLTSSKEVEWYTPPNIIEKARSVLGGIDLDPASCDMAQKWIRATHYFTKEDNGLVQEWTGTVFLNPPYRKTGNRSNQEIWVNKLIKELEYGRVKAAIALTKSVPGYNWWDSLILGKWPGPFCITRGRLAFINSAGKVPGQSKAASTLWYAGPHPKRFKAVFGELGRIFPQGELDYLF